MIVGKALDALYGIFEVLTRIIDIPNMPEETSQYIEEFFGYLESGASLLINYTPFTYLMVLFTIGLAVEVGVRVYHFVMWVIKKIPFLGMS